MNTKYEFEFSQEDVNKNTIRLTNQLWKLIPMKENDEEWEKQQRDELDQLRKRGFRNE